MARQFGINLREQVITRRGLKNRLPTINTPKDKAHPKEKRAGKFRSNVGPDYSQGRDGLGQHWGKR